MKQYGHLLRMLHCCITQEVTSTLAQMDLTSAQGRILGFLAHQEQPPCPRDIEEEFHLSHPTVSGLLTRLARKDFIEFRPDPNDRRSKRICIRPKGTACNQRVFQAIQSTEQRVVDGFTQQEQELFHTFLLRAAKNMGCDPQLHFIKEDENHD